jgi:hypothetical protein
MTIKKATYIDFCVQVICRPTANGGKPIDPPDGSVRGCSSSQPEDYQLVSSDAPLRLVLSTLTQVFLVGADVMIDFDKICVGIEQTIVCAAGCGQDFFGVPVRWYGNGTMLAPGEYTIGIPVQTAPGFPLLFNVCDNPVSGQVTLLLFNASEESYKAALYNSALVTGGCLCTK